MRNPPENMTGTPAATALPAPAPDVLSDALRLLRLHSELFLPLELHAPFCLTLHAGTGHLHMVERGTCLLEVAGGKAPLQMTTGDFVLVPSGTGHRLKSAQGQARPVAVADLLQRTPPSRGRRIRLGEGGPQTLLLCVTFSVASARVQSLLSVLPPVLHLRNQPDQPPGWLELTLRYLSAEAQGRLPGHQFTMSRLIDVIVVEALRAWSQELPEGQGGWLGALRDPRVGEALNQLHRAPASAWTVTRLAARVGMSRSNFSERFLRLVGTTPMQYLVRWRMNLAAEALEVEGASVREVAERVGYQSEAAFSRVFKRHLGMPPAAFRRQQG